MKSGLLIDKNNYLEAKKLAREAILSSRSDHIKEQIHGATSSAKQLWNVANKILHRNIAPPTPDDDCQKLATSFCSYFTEKIKTIHNSISASLSTMPPSAISQQSRPYVGPILSSLPPVTVSEVAKLIHSLPNKTSPLDPLPTSILKRYAVMLSPFIARLVNESLSQGIFPKSFKTAQVLPVLKKHNLDPSIPSSYRPISNLSTISKLLERLVLKRIGPHITSSSNYTKLQSAYRPGHSTETALLHILDSSFRACGAHKAVMLVGLDLSAAFDTIRHDILTSRLSTDFGITGSALSWITSYLSDRTQFIKMGRHSSAPSVLGAGVPQGSVLGPLLFTTYTTPVSDIINQSNISFHQYADDTCLFTVLSCDNPQTMIQPLIDCVHKIQQWHLANFLQLNPTKSEVMLIGSSHQLNKIKHINSIDIAGATLPISKSIKLLGVTLDDHLHFDRHISSTVKACNYHIQAIKHVRHLLSTNIANTLACSLVTSRLDYCNSLLHGTASTRLAKLQRVQNQLAKVTTNHPSTVTSSSSNLSKLHWLPIKYRVIFKIALLTYKIISSKTPIYLNDLITTRTNNRQLRSSTSISLFQPVGNSKLINRSFSYCSPAIWNSLPPAIRSTPSLTCFKKLLKTHLFTKAFGHDPVRL